MRPDGDSATYNHKNQYVSKSYAIRLRVTFATMFQNIGQMVPFFMKYTLHPSV
jgi:hypothetical protein